MGGGLMQITTYGTQDLTLTGNPEITFFNIIYRRYTNFGMKTISVSFDNSPDFNSSSYINIPKNNGDLLSKVILKIKLPKIDLTDINDKLLKKNNNVNKDEYISNYDYFNYFYNKLLNIVNNFFDNSIYYKNSISYINDLKNFILKYLNTSEFSQFFSSINFYFNNVVFNKNNSYNIDFYTNASLFKIINNDLIYIYDSFTYKIISFEEFKFLIYKNMEILKNLNGIIYDKLQTIIFSDPKIKVCWVNKIGIYLFNSIDLYIGSNKIYSLSDTYINNYGEINYKNQKLYDELIGNKQQINNFSSVHDETILYLPVPFWNLNNYGLAFPLIALQYNSIQIKINTKKFLDCIKIYYDTVLEEQIDKNEIINIFTNEINSLIANKLEITMILEYIYLDLIERKKFAQSAHEYLIEQVQEIEFDNLTKTNNSFNLEIFHCCKDMYWFAQKYPEQNDIFNNNPDVYDYTFDRKIVQYTDNEKILIDYVSMVYYPNRLFNPFTFNNGVYILSIENKYQLTISFIINYLSNIYLQPNANKNLNIIIKESYIYLNSTQLIGEYSPFFNYLHAYNYYNSTPQLGLNLYSLCLKPMEFQPSGSANMSRISSIILKLKINEKIIGQYNDYFSKSPEKMSNYKFIFQTRNFNILRVIGGICATAYTY
jgi:hypothetical protein